MCIVPILKPATGCCEVPFTILKYPNKKIYGYDWAINQYRQENCEENCFLRRVKFAVEVVSNNEGEMIMKE